MKIKLTKVLFYFRKKLLITIMRTFIFLFCTITFGFSSDNILSQNTKIVIDNDKTVTVDEVFDLIRNQTDYTFIYQEDLFKNAPKVHLQKGVIKANKLLEKSLAFGDFNFSLSDKNTIILEKTVEDIATVAQRKISGITSDNDGLPLPGVNVIIKGTNKGVISDFEGSYSIEVGNEDVLVFSYLGYATQEVKVGNLVTLNIVMQPNADELSEVIITAIGTKMLVDESGSTSSIVKTEGIVKSGEAGVINALAGKASGVRIGKSNGDPGSGSSIQIRGANTIQGASQPLIILDGIPVSNDNIGDVTISQQSRLDDINSKDIESVQVLKGASAAALWGSRAANGVIVITTKNGSLGKKPTVQYSFTQSFDDINVRTPLQNKFGQGRDGVWQISRAESWGDKIADRAGGADEVNETGRYFLSNTTGNIYYPVTTKNSRETFVDSNYDQVFQTGVYAQHNISISGGGEKASYFFSYENLVQEGIIKNFDYKRQNLRLNTKTQLTKWLSWSNRISYTNTDSNRIRQAGEDTNGILLGLLRTSPDFDISDYKGTYVAANGDVFPDRQRSYRVQFGESENPVYNNPLWTINEQKSPNQVNRFIINPELTIDPVNWLKVILRGGLDYYSDSRGSFFPVSSASGARSAGLWTQSDITSRELNFDGIAIATQNINKDVEVTATLGLNFNDRQRFSNTNTISPFAVNASLPTPDLNPDQAASSWNRFIQKIRSNRGYGILGFNLFDQLFVNVSGAMEASSTIKGSFFYPSADLAWQFSDLIESETLSFGKLRFAWGKVGVQPAAYKFNTLATTGFSTFGGSFLVDSEKGNSNLKPEIKTEWEVGTDLRFFNNRISLGLTYYNNETKDILFAVNTNPSSGFSTNYTNAATIENKGFEIDLNGKIIDNQDLKVSLNANFNNNENKVVDIAGAETVDIGGTSKAVKGYPMSSFWLPGTLRNDDGSLALDANGFPQLDTDRRVIGDPNPDWRGGLGMELKWKNIDFSFLFEHSQGGDFINRTRVVLNGFGMSEEVGNEVTLTEDLTNINGTVFTAGTTVRGNIQNFGGGNVLLDELYYRGIGGGLGFNKLNDLYIEDATWTKLRNVTLGYTLKGLKLSSKLSLESLRISVTGRDLILWTDLVGVDPETNNYGVSNAFGMNYFNNPGTRSILFNLQANF
tara:strand:- start:17129 stop:20617 length:3489 start_codon:yes stop_codon:yes gene_type:complete